MKQSLCKMKVKFGLFIITILFLTACSSTFDNLVESASAEMGKGNFTEAYELYTKALEEKGDPSITNIVQNIEKYEQLLEAIDNGMWNDALNIGQEIAADDEAPYALKKEVRELLSEIEIVLEANQEFNKEMEKIEQLIDEDNISEANQLLLKIETAKLSEVQERKLSTVQEQLATVKKKLAKAEQKQLEREKKAKEAEERAKIAKMNNLQAKYTEKAEVAYMRETEVPVSTNEVNDHLWRIFEKWDNLLNELWTVLGDEMPRGKFEQLRKEQLKWIQEKEAAADKAMEGLGTMDTAEGLSSDWEYTEERVYYLINNYLK